MKRATMRRWIGRPGFTLIELLIAMSLLGLVALALSGALGFGARVWETGEEHVDDQARLVAVQGLLRRLLAQATVPAELVVPGAGLAAEEAFAGESTAVRFVAPVPPYLGLGGLYEFTLALDRRPERTDLVLQRRPRARSIETPETSTLVEDVAALAVRYLAPGDDLAAPHWVDRWQTKGSLPASVEIQIEFARGDRRRWPLFTVLPHITPAPRAEP